MSRSVVIAVAVAVLWLCSVSVAESLYSPEASLERCQRTLALEGEKYIAGYARSVAGCLKKVAVEVVKYGRDTSGAVDICIGKFRKLYDSRIPAWDLTNKLRSRLTMRCDPAPNSHTLADLLGGPGVGVAQSLSAARIGNWCGGFGDGFPVVYGSGAISSLEDWVECVVRTHKLAARTAIVAQYPRALEWLYYVGLGMAAVSPPMGDPNKVSDALAELLSLRFHMEGGQSLDWAAAGQPSTQFPATGQTTCYDASGGVTDCQDSGQDGRVQAGGRLRYVDNGDGTLTDLNTGLMWEKKSDDGTLHDWDNAYSWSDAVSVFVAQLNAGSGFAGYKDWRVPNVKELQSIVDYENKNPAVSTPFHTGCVGACGGITCACTPSSAHWSATTVDGAPTGGWFVYFGAGEVRGWWKTSLFSVRAVRGGS